LSKEAVARLYTPEEIEGLMQIYNQEKAALVSRELVGDYGRISKGGQWLRKKMIPFYSWMEINAPRYWRIFRNLPVETGATGTKTRIGMVVGKKAAFTTAKMLMLYTAVQAFNRWAWPDEEEELGESQRRQMHLILGRREDGTIITIRLQGALSDALGWIGAEDLPEDLRALRAGRTTIGKLLKEAAAAPLQRLAQGIRPDIKLPTELLSGRSFYPDIFNYLTIY